MAVQLRSSWLGALLIGAMLNIGLCPPLLAQGDESTEAFNERSNSASGAKTVFKRLFGGSSESSVASDRSVTTKSKKPSRSNGAFKPGTITGGLIRQFKATTEGSDETDFTLEEQRTPTSTSQQTTAAVPTPPSRMATRIETDTKLDETLAKRFLGTNNRVPQRSSATYTNDPPSIVGTGIDTKSATNRFSKPSLPVSSGTLDRSESRTNGLLPKVISPSEYSDHGDRPVSVSAPARPPSGNAHSAQISDAGVSTRREDKVTKQAESARDLATNIAQEKSKATHTNVDSVASTSSGDLELAPVAKKSVPPSSRKKDAEYTEEGYHIPNSRYSTTTPSNVESDSETSSRKSSNNTKETSTATITTSSASTMQSRLAMNIPQVELFVAGPAAIQVGKSVPYEVTVKNQGREMLSGVIVNLSLPPSVKSKPSVAVAGDFESERDDTGRESLLWHVRDLGPSQSRSFKVNLEASKPEHFAMDVEWTVLPQTGQVNVDVQQPQLNVALEGPSEVRWGSPELYRLRVRNPGNAEVKDVVVKLTAEPYGSNESKIGDIAAGTERIIEVELTFQQAGAIKIVGEAHSEASGLHTNSEVDVRVQQSELNLSWSAPDEQYQDSVATYILKLSNPGSSLAENIHCLVMLPAGLKQVSLPSDATVVGNEIRWSVNRLEAGSAQEFNLELQALEAGGKQIRCEAKCDGGGESSSDATVQVNSISDLKLSVIDPVAPAPVGQEVAYDLVVVNRGSRPAKAVKVLAQFSNGIEPIRVEGSSAQLLPGQVIFDPIEAIGPGEKITLRVVAQAAEAGVHRFRAELECEDGETQLIEEESTRYLATSRSEASKATISSMIIGVPKEVKDDEYRVAMLPVGVEELIQHGHRVLIQANAGIGSGLADHDYLNAGAELVATGDEIFATADLIVKVKEPLPVEWRLIRSGQCLFTYFHFAASRILTEAMLRSGATCLAYETLRDPQGRLPLLTPMSEVAGRMSIQEGAKYLERPQMGRGILLGGVPGVAPAHITILGGGVVGANAARIAAGFQADVAILDINLDRLRYLDDVMPANVNALFSDRHTIRDQLRLADLVIGSILIPGAKAPHLVKRDDLRLMKPGSVIIDVAIDQGGCVETSRPTTHQQPTFVVDDVVHYCVTNMPGAVGRTSTYALCNVTLPWVLQLANQGIDSAIANSPALTAAMNIRKNVIMNQAVATTFGMAIG